MSENGSLGGCRKFVDHEDKNEGLREPDEEKMRRWGDRRWGTKERGGKASGDQNMNSRGKVRSHPIGIIATYGKHGHLSQQDWHIFVENAR